MLHYICLQDCLTVFLLCIYIYINKLLKQRPVKIMGKISKVMPQPQSISPGKGREALWQKVQIFRLNLQLNRTYYSLLKFTSKIFKIVSFSQIYSELRKFRTIRLHSPQIMQNLHHLLTLYIMFQTPAPAENPAEFQRITQVPHNSPTVPRITRNSHHFLTLYIMFQTPAPAENPAEFQRIMQIPCDSPTQSTNHAKFAPFANIIHYVSDA